MSGAARSAGIAAKVIVIGQPWAASTRPPHCAPAIRATWAPGRGSVHGEEWPPISDESVISACHAGWKSTSSMRFPKRSCVLSTGGFSLASRPHSTGAPPHSAPVCSSRSRAQPAPSRSRPSTSAVWSVNRLRSTIGGAWLVTPWVAVCGLVVAAIDEVSRNREECSYASQDGPRKGRGQEGRETRSDAEADRVRKPHGSEDDGGGKEGERREAEEGAAQTARSLTFARRACPPWDDRGA